MDIDYRTLARELLKESGTTNKTVSSTADASYGHGNGGLFSAPGLSRPVFSAMVLPQMGVQSILPVRSSMDTNPLYGIFTGVTATSGNEPTTSCGDWPEAGLSKLCEHTFVFGRQGRQSRVFDISRLGELTNRGEFIDLQMMGNPYLPTVGGNEKPNGPAVGMFNDQVLNREVGKAIYELGVAWSRDFARELYTGTPQNNQGEGRKYFYGFDTLINAGYRDAETGVACPAADSLIVSFGGQNVTNAANAIVRTITYMYRNLRYIARSTGLDPVKWVVAMPWSLFYEITEVWPCAYLTYRCQQTAGSTNFVDAEDQIKMRDDMRGDIFTRTGQYLLVDGQKIPVVLDDAITEGNNGNGTFTSQLYFIPMTVLGNVPVSMLEYFNFDGPGAAMEAAKTFAPDGMYYTTDGGRFLWHKKPPANFCVQLMAITRPRLLLLTPFLAGRLTNVMYSPLMHERSGFTGDTYFYNGGKTDRVGFGPSFYSPVG